MATVNYTAGACPALLIAQNDIMGQNDPSNLMEPVGLVQAVKDPSNVPLAQFEQLGAGDGHGPKAVRVVARKPLIAADVADEKACESGEKIPRYETLATANLHSHLPIQIDEADIRKLCEGYSQYMSVPAQQRGTAAVSGRGMEVMREVYDVIQMAFPAMRSHINKQLWGAAALAPGVFRDGASSKTFTFLKADHSPYLKGFNELKQAIRRTTFTGAPIIVGEGAVELATMSLEYGCCNDGGTDFGTMRGNPGFKFYSDLDAAAALGNANRALAFMPGTMHMFSYNSYVGNFASPMGTMARGTIADPAVPGLRYDIRIMPNECGEYYDVFLDHHYGLWYADDLFKEAVVSPAYAGDDRAGVNGIFLIEGAIAS